MDKWGTKTNKGGLGVSQTKTTKITRTIRGERNVIRLFAFGGRVKLDFSWVH